jgi:hypothetical protein
MRDRKKERERERGGGRERLFKEKEESPKGKFVILQSAVVFIFFSFFVYDFFPIPKSHFLEILDLGLLSNTTLENNKKYANFHSLFEKALIRN